MKLNLVDDPSNNFINDWMNINAENLTMKWGRNNISSSANAKVDITLWGYWEDLEGHEFVEIAALGRDMENTGIYQFNPKLLVRSPDQEILIKDAWKKFTGGLIQIRVSDNQEVQRGGDG